MSTPQVSSATVSPVATRADERVRRASPPNPVLVKQIQARLILVGYDPGPVDGMMGPRTRTAIRAFQQDRGLRVDGEASELLLGILATYSGLQDDATRAERE